MSVPEAGSEQSTTEKENAVKVLGALSYPVTESNHLRTPTDNSSDTDTTRKLPYTIPEEKNNKEKKKPNWAKQRLHALLALKLRTATTVVSQDAASSSIERFVNCSSSGRCTPLSGIGKKSNHSKASEESKATGDLLQQHRCKDELKTSSALSAIGPSGKFCSSGLVTLTLGHRCAS